MVHKHQAHRHKPKRQHHGIQLAIGNHVHRCPFALGWVFRVQCRSLIDARSTSRAVCRPRCQLCHPPISLTAQITPTNNMRRPSSLEELLYQRLMSSHAFHAWVRRVHARINRIPLEEQTLETDSSVRLSDYRPTTWHKVNAFRILFWDELKKSFTFRS